MNFMDAVDNMIAGKKLMRRDWSGYYIVIMVAQHYIWSIGSSNTTPSINAHIYIPNIEEIYATDWMIKT